MYNRGEPPYIYLFVLGIVACTLIVGSVSSWALVKETDLWPIYLERDDGVQRTVDAMWPFFHFRETPVEYYNALRPFASAGYHWEERRHYIRFLPPYFMADWDDDEADIRIPGLGHKRLDFHPKRGITEREIGLYPFFAYGEKEGLPDHLVFFPIYGWFYDRFFFDYMKFVLFPLYVYGQREGFESHSFFWPLIVHGQGDGITQRVVWPFFGYYHNPGRRIRQWYGWRLWLKDHKFIDTHNASQRFAMFPFFDKTVSSQRQSLNLGLFLYRSEDIERPGFSYHRRYAPWPFYVRTWGSHNNGTVYWPLWGVNERKREDRKQSNKFYLWPLWLTQEEVRFDRSSFRLSCMLIWWWERTWYPAGTFTLNDQQVNRSKERMTDQWRLWPLILYDEYPEGGQRLIMLDPLWVREDSREARHYSPFYRLFVSIRNHDGTGYDSLIGRLWYRYRELDEHGWQLFHVVKYRDQAHLGKRWQILGGLISYEQHSDSNLWKIFGVQLGG